MVYAPYYKILGPNQFLLVTNENFQLAIPVKAELYCLLHGIQGNTNAYWAWKKITNIRRASAQPASTQPWSNIPLAVTRTFSPVSPPGDILHTLCFRWEHRGQPLRKLKPV